jgi:hypothetical protein
MLKNISFLTPASALALATLLTACVLVTDDGATTADTGTSGDGDGDSATTGDGDGDQTGDGDGDQTGDGDGDQTGDGDGDGEPGDGDGDAPSACGWDAAQMTPGYYCGGSGEDPEGMNPITCPDGLVEGAECGELTGAGCCDGNGDNWYCGVDDMGAMAVAFDSCAD